MWKIVPKPEDLRNVPACQLQEESKRHQLVATVQRGLTSVYRDHDVPEEDQKDLECCLQSISADALPFHWDYSFYAQPCPRPATCRIRPSKEAREVSSEDEEEPAVNPDIDSEFNARRTDLKVGNLYLTIYQRSEVKEGAWSWSISR